ncbi:hypothetical protein ACFE04_019899 [Oxalis oulophora]
MEVSSPSPCEPICVSHRSHMSFEEAASSGDQITGHRPRITSSLGAYEFFVSKVTDERLLRVLSNGYKADDSHSCCGGVGFLRKWRIKCGCTCSSFLCILLEADLNCQRLTLEGLLAFIYGMGGVKFHVEVLWSTDYLSFDHDFSKINPKTDL